MKLKVRQMTCGVCQKDLTKGYVLWCARCKTPQHADCWEYAQSCAIFGCSGEVTRSNRPPKKVKDRISSNEQAYLYLLVCLFGPAVMMLVIIFMTTIFS